MSKLFSFTVSGYDNFFPSGSIYPNPKEPSLFLSLSHNVDVNYPSCKRSRISDPFIFSEELLEPKEEVSIEVLPDECLFEIFRRLPRGPERNASACVSKRWLMLLSNICGAELYGPTTTQLLQPNDKPTENVVKDPDVEVQSCLSRNLGGKKATDVRLAAISVGTACQGGLGKLLIRGSNHDRRVTDLGLRAIAKGSPSLKVLSLWNLFSIGDEGLCQIANGCHLLEKLDLCRCPAISNKALLDLAKNCPTLTDITIVSCPKIGDEGLLALGKHCPNLKSVSIKNCSLVGDKGIVGLISSTPYVLKKLKLQGLNITDVSLAVIGHYGKSVTDLFLSGLVNISKRGFWVMGNGHGLQKLKSLTITFCHGVTNIGIEALGKGSPNLKQFCLVNGPLLSDTGLLLFAKAAKSLEILQLEECHGITQFGFFGALLNCGAKLKALSLVNCLGIKDVCPKIPSCVPRCKSLRSLSIRNCPGFGNTSLALLGKLCPRLKHVELGELEGISDSGFFPLIENCELSLVKVNLSGCVNLTDKVVSSITAHHGWTLETLNLDGCRKITDASLVAIAESCPLLNDLDMSKCAITDFGIFALAQANQFNLQILSISGCSFVSEKSLPALMKLGWMLVGLNLQNCKGFNSGNISLLMEQLWRCDILS